MSYTPLVPLVTELHSYDQSCYPNLLQRAGWGLADLLPESQTVSPRKLADTTVMNQKKTLLQTKQDDHNTKSRKKSHDVMWHTLFILAVLGLLAYAIYWITSRSRSIVSKKKAQSKLETSKQASLAANKSAQSSLVQQQTQQKLCRTNDDNSNSNVLPDDDTNALDNVKPAVERVPVTSSGLIKGKPPSFENGLLFSPSAGLIPVSKDGCIYGGLGKPICIGCKSDSCETPGCANMARGFIPFRSTSKDLRGLVGEYYPTDPFR